MTQFDPAEGERITDRRQLAEYMEAGCKAPPDWRIGTEHEKFVFDLADHAPAPYDGPSGIQAMLQGLTAYGWEPVTERGNVIALHRGNANITLEPAGQLELSGEPLTTLHESCREVYGHLEEVQAVAKDLGVGLIGLGAHPTARREDMPWMPKERYAIMHRYMPTRGGMGLDMMTRSCGVQVNLDFASEADMVRKLRVSLALQPIATALFANSPFLEGRPSGFLSQRAHFWTDTDPDRCGIPPFVFEPGMGFERYVEYALDVPMYLVIRNGEIIDASGQSFREFLAGRLPALPGELPTLHDWEDHLTTLFPEVRVKRFIEQRGADAGPWERLCALPALWTGLLYDAQALDAAETLCHNWQAHEITALMDDVSREGLQARIRGQSIQPIAREVVAIARTGLARRARLDSHERDEAYFLDELGEIAESGITPAEHLLAAYHGRWNQSVEPVFREYSY